ncbi:MAG: hypothetical protein ACNA7X_02930 [Dehalococcoidia bacterium]
MKRPPLLLRLRIPGKKIRPGCWLPIFLLLPLALALLIVLLPVVLVVGAILQLRRRRNRQSSTAGIVLSTVCSFRGIMAAVGLICSTPGLRVDVTDDDGRFEITVI